MSSMLCLFTAVIGLGCKIAPQHDDSDPTRSAEALDGAGPLLGERLQKATSSCEYIHRFDNDANYEISSTSGEEIRATYSLYEPEGADSKWPLQFRIDSDNNVVDCEGDQIDESGRDITAFLTFPDDDSALVFRGPTHTVAFMVWTRQ